MALAGWIAAQDAARGIWLRLFVAVIGAIGFAVFLFDISRSEELEVNSEYVRLRSRIFGRTQISEAPRDAIQGISITDDIIADIAPSGSSAYFLVNLELDAPELPPRFVLALRSREKDAKAIASEASGRLGVSVSEGISQR